VTDARAPQGPAGRQQPAPHATAGAQPDDAPPGAQPAAVTLLLAPDEAEDLQRAAAQRGMSLSDLLGEAATLLLFEERLRALRPKVEHPGGGGGPPAGYA